MIPLRDLSSDELDALVVERLGADRFRAEQLFRWIHARGATSLEEMTDLPRGLRERLATEATLAPLAIDLEQRSRDGTRKLRLRCVDGAIIETVLIPDGTKLTQCVSSQVGCALDCRFCATALLGFGRQLGAGEIVDQVYRGRALAAEEGRRVTNLVFMGMGEPLHNYANLVRALALLTDGRGADCSHRRITVSTAGLVPGIERLGQEPFQVNLAISLNATTDEVRDELMPINRRWNIAALLDAVRRYPLERRRRVTFEYVLLAGLNDSPADARRLARLLRGIPCKVNLIPWNAHAGGPYRRPADAAVAAFQAQVKQAGLPTYLRATRGEDIDAACGQLATRDPDTGTVPSLRLLRRAPGGPSTSKA